MTRGGPADRRLAFAGMPHQLAVAVGLDHIGGLFRGRGRIPVLCRLTLADDLLLKLRKRGLDFMNCLNDAAERFKVKARNRYSAHQLQGSGKIPDALQVALVVRLSRPRHTGCLAGCRSLVDGGDERAAVRSGTDGLSMLDLADIGFGAGLLDRLGAAADGHQFIGAGATDIALGLDDVLPVVRPRLLDGGDMLADGRLIFLDLARSVLKF